MRNSPKTIPAKIKAILAAWQELAPNETFGGMTLAQFEAATSPSFSTRRQLKDLEEQRKQLLKARAEADEVSQAKISLVERGVTANPVHGQDSGLYEKMGFKRRSRRPA